MNNTLLFLRRSGSLDSDRCSTTRRSWAATCITLATACLTIACDAEPETGERRNIAPVVEPREGCVVAVREGRELVIRSRVIVDHPTRTTWNGDPDDPVSGAWHFGKLMTQMAGDENPELFVERWLETWETDRTVNGQTLAARSSIRSQVLDSWPRLANGRLDLTQAPFRLLAIVNRMDLRDETRAGEGRFVFGVLSPSGSPMQFTVILEYNLPTEVMTVEDWAQAWHATRDAPTAEAFRVALQNVTDAFTAADALPLANNGSAISQVRSNEIALAGPWELREFFVNNNGRLIPRTVALTPRNDLDGSTTLADYINENEVQILDQRHVVRATLDDSPFRGASSTNNIDFWDAPGIGDNEVRHLFSLNTCNGCHGAETQTGFLHVQPRDAGQVSSLSAFMTGTDVLDPVTGESRHFDDIERRKQDFKTLLCD